MPLSPKALDIDVSDGCCMVDPKKASLKFVQANFPAKAKHFWSTFEQAHSLAAKNRPLAPYTSKRGRTLLMVSLSAPLETPSRIRRVRASAHQPCVPSGVASHVFARLNLHTLDE